MEIHPVLGRALARAGKSAALAPDGRKIVLVLFGGIMNAARGGGALAAFEELGLTAAFDEIYTMSSGFANACYFLSGQMKQGVSMYYQELAGAKFLNVLRFWKPADLEYFVRQVETTKPLDLDKLFASRTRLYTMVTKVPDLDQGLFLEIHDFDRASYFELLRACSSLPFVGKGAANLKDGAYRDVFYDEALRDFMRQVLSAGATDIVIVYNYEWQRSYVRSMLDLDLEHVYEFTPRFFAGRHKWLQKLTRFETRGKVLKKQAEAFGNEVKQAFGSSEPLRLL